MIDEVKIQKRIRQLEVHLEWISSNLINSRVSQKYIAEISKLRAVVAEQHRQKPTLISTNQKTDQYL